MHLVKLDPASAIPAAHTFHARLVRFNSQRLAPQSPDAHWVDGIRAEALARIAEGKFIEAERAAISNAAALAPTDVEGFMRWFEGLEQNGPGQNDELFPWLADMSTFEEMRWFLTQEAAGEAGFDDLVAMTQVKAPVRAKLEMAANYWDEMGRGHERGMHGPMLDAVVEELALMPSTHTTVWESLALANMMVGLATNRRYAYQSIGALGAIEMTAPGRVTLVNQGLSRLKVPSRARRYFQLHAGLDVQHSKSWNREVIAPLVATRPDLGRWIAEGALLRLSGGARCFARYRAHFGLLPVMRDAA